MTITYDPKRKPTVRILLNEKALKQFKPEWKAMLQLAFHDGNNSADDVAVTTRLSGYSDAQTFTVQVKYDDRTPSFVIKFGLRSIIASEFENSQKVDGNALYGNPVIPNRIYPLKGEEIDWAFIQSTLAVESQTLLAYLTSLKKNPVSFSPDSVAQILRGVFKRRSDTIQSSIGIAYAYRDFYDRLLPVHFHFRGRDIGVVKNFKEIDGATLDSSKLLEYEKTLSKTKDIVYLKNFRIEKENKEELTLCPDQPPTDESFKIRIKYKLDNGQGPFNQLSEPTSFFATDPETRSEILHKPVRGFVRKDPETHKMPSTFTYSKRNAKDTNDGKDDKIIYPNPIYYKDELLGTNNQMKMALIHGDLNLFNILVSSDGNQTQKFLIDFADTRRGPVLLDFQWLEVNVILWLLAPEIRKPSVDNKAIINILKALHRLDSEPPPHLQHLKMWYTVLLQIRLFAQPYTTKDWSEYYRGLTLLLLGSLRLHNKPIPELEPSNLHVAFLFAATTLCWTKLESVDLTKVSKEIRTPPSLDTTSGYSSDESINEQSIIKLGDPSDPSAPILPSNRPEALPIASAEGDIDPIKGGTELNTPGHTPVVTDKPALPLTTTPNRRDFLKRVAIGGAAVLVTATGSIGGWLYYQNKQVKQILIGVAINYDGEKNAIGVDQQKALDVARLYFKEKVNETNISLDFIEKSTASDDKGVLQKAFDELIGLPVIAIIGPGLSDQANALHTTLTTLRIPVIGPSTTAKGILEGRPYFTRVSLPVEYYAPNVISVALEKIKLLEKRKIRVAVAYADDDDFTMSQKDTFLQTINQQYSNTMEVVTTPTFKTGDTTFDSQIKAILVDAKADLVVISGLSRDAGLFLNQLREKDQNIWVIAGNGFNATSVFELCGPHCNINILVAQAYSHHEEYQDTQIEKDFIKFYQRVVEDDQSYPSQFMAQMFTAVHVIVESLRRIDGIAYMSVDELREALHKYLSSGDASFDTPLGKLWFDSSREVHQTDVYVATVEKDTRDQYHYETIKRFPGK